MNRIDFLKTLGISSIGITLLPQVVLSAPKRVINTIEDLQVGDEFYFKPSINKIHPEYPYVIKEHKEPNGTICWLIEEKRDQRPYYFYIRERSFKDLTKLVWEDGKFFVQLIEFI